MDVVLDPDDLVLTGGYGLEFLLVRVVTDSDREDRDPSSMEAGSFHSGVILVSGLSVDNHDGYLRNSIPAFSFKELSS